MKQTVSRGRESAATGVSRTMPTEALPPRSTPSSFHLARMSSLPKKPVWRNSSLPVASKKIWVGIISTPYFLPASSSCHTSMNSTFILPTYSFLSPSRIGAIALQGMHLLAPRSSSLGSLASASDTAAPVVPPGVGELAEFRDLLPLSTMAAAAAPTTSRMMMIFAGVFMIELVFCEIWLNFAFRA